MGKDILEIIDVEPFDQDSLVEKLRQVNMLMDRSVYPYKDARIELRKIPHSELCPAQRYVLTDSIINKQELLWRLKSRSYDLFNLDGFLRLHCLENGETKFYDLLPPVVEESKHDGGQTVNIVCDGMHRVYLSYIQWIVPQVVFIRDVPEKFPYYAYPLRGKQWGDIEILDKIPCNFIKKWHRVEKNKELYRDFNSAFKNVGAPRGKGD